MKVTYKIYRKDLLTIIDCLIATNATKAHPIAFTVMFGGFLHEIQKRLWIRAYREKERYTVSFTPIELMLILVMLESCIVLRPDLPHIKTTYMRIDQPIPPHVMVAINLTRRHLQSITGETKRFVLEGGVS